MTININTIAETNNFIILETHKKIAQPGSYQTEADLECELIDDLKNQGYEYRQDLDSNDKLLQNLRRQLQKLNKTEFSDSEWQRFLDEYLNKPNESVIDKTDKIHNDYVYAFTFDSGKIQNIRLFDKEHIAENSVQVINQFKQKSRILNRYDVTILVNGLPVVQIELKKRGMPIREAFNQIQRYSKESFNAEHSLFKFLQVFVISSGTETRYFANTTKRDKNSFDFTVNWALLDNFPLNDLKDFTATFFQKNTLLNVLLRYAVFDTKETLLLLRPYQIAAAERILWKIKTCHQYKNWGKEQNGGYIWHATGSGKTLTSYKAARMAAELDCVDKVLFVVDRKDLDYQTMQEYQRFSKDSVNGTDNTAGLKRILNKDDGKIVVTTIQKLNNLCNERDLPVYQKQVVIIFDECHRSQFGEIQKNIKKRFKKFCQFGFTGTPIFKENSCDGKTTESIFGERLHSYVITDAIRDEKVLKFKIDYNDTRPEFRDSEKELDTEKLKALEAKQAFLHPERIGAVTRYILKNFNQKTHRFNAEGKGFNAMFAVSSIDAAKLYYQEFRKQQKDSEKPLKIATIFSFAVNEEQQGAIADEGEPSALDSSSKEFLNRAIADYNRLFGSSYSTESESFQNYYRDLSQKVKERKIDLLIVVGMFLTGFDAPRLNTLFVDKDLRYHGLIQAFSRTNRILDKTKAHGNIVTFRNLEQAVEDAVLLYGDSNQLGSSIVIARSYQEHMYGYTDDNGVRHRGYAEIVGELQSRFFDPAAIKTEADKKAFVELFGEFLRVENILQNYDEFTALKEWQKQYTDNLEAVEKFKQEYSLTDEQFVGIKNVKHVFSERDIQNYRSAYNDIREWFGRAREGEELKIDWSNIVFETELLKSQEIDLDYILGLIFEYYKKTKDRPALIEEIRRMILSGTDNRAKESLIVDFINQADLDNLLSREKTIEMFYQYAGKELKREEQALIEQENLNEELLKYYLKASFSQGYASEYGTELGEIISHTGARIGKNSQYKERKQRIFQKITKFVEKFKNINGSFSD